MKLQVKRACSRQRSRFAGPRPDDSHCLISHRSDGATVHRSIRIWNEGPPATSKTASPTRRAVHFSPNGARVGHAFAQDTHSASEAWDCGMSGKFPIALLFNFFLPFSKVRYF